MKFASQVKNFNSYTGLQNSNSKQSAGSISAIVELLNNVPGRVSEGGIKKLATKFGYVFLMMF